MPSPTPVLGLARAVAADLDPTYLTVDLAASLATLDGLFDTTGHTHFGAGQGGSIMPLHEPIMFAADNAYDIGAWDGTTGTGRPANVYVGRDLIQTNTGMAMLGYLGVRGNVDPAYALRVEGQAYFSAGLGVGTAADARYAFRLRGGAEVEGELRIGGAGWFLEQQVQLASVAPPAVPVGTDPAYKRLYPKADGYYFIGDDGIEMPLGGGGGGATTTPWYADAATGAWLVSADNAHDIGASGVSRPRDVFVGSHVAINSGPQTWALHVQGDAYMSHLGIGDAPRPDKGIHCNANAQIFGPLGVGADSVDNTGIRMLLTLKGDNPSGIDCTPIFDITTTGQLTGLEMGLGSQDGGYVGGDGVANLIKTPDYRTGWTMVTNYGLKIENQGHGNVTNAYGVFIAAATGATALNESLHVEGDTRLTGMTMIGAGNARMWDGGIDDPLTPGERLVWCNALTVTPGSLHAAGVTSNGPVTISGVHPLVIGDPSRSLAVTTPPGADILSLANHMPGGQSYVDLIAGSSCEMWFNYDRATGTFVDPAKPWGRLIATADYGGSGLFFESGDPGVNALVGRFNVGNTGNLTLSGNATIAGGAAFGPGITVNTGRGVNQGSIVLCAGTGAANDFQMFAENGSVYLWFSNPVGGMMVQSGGGSVWNPISASAFNVTSTRTVKTDLVPLEAPTALGQVLDPRVTPTSFTDTNGARQVGFIAEEMVEVVPEVVSLDEDGAPQGIHYGALVSVLWSAMRDLANRLSALEPPPAPRTPTPTVRRRIGATS